ncbi:F-box/WD repeat-containing protein 5-like [Artemia franciscana]|uniref:F-box/WD repeat-containing protein 5-like n=1 Tax=Artemia franciscana TaxID=6661 RepID=UPI0032DA9E9F
MHSWEYITDAVFIKILDLIDIEDISNVSKVCRRWKELCLDEYFWKKRLLKDWKIDPTIGIKKGALSWHDEYIRLWRHVPIVETEILKEHTNQVLHVSFSNNGKFFATCSKDGYVLVWDAGYPARIRHYKDMKTFSWKYTQYSKFNASDTSLLVSGVHFGSHSNTGEIAVLSLTDGNFDLQCRVSNRPYDIFGTWYTDSYLISGDQHWLGNLISTSNLWLNRASQETDSEFTSVMNRMFRFFNRSASSVRGVMVANCVTPKSHFTSPMIENRPNFNSGDSDAGSTTSKGNKPSHISINQNPPGLSRTIDNLGQGRLWAGDPDFQYWRSTESFSQAPNAIYYTNYEAPTVNDGDSDADMPLGAGPSKDYVDSDDTYRQTRSQSMPNTTAQRQESQYYWSEGANSSSEYDTDEDDEGNVELLDKREKFLIFSTGDETYTPHQIGFKRIPPFAFNKRIDPGPTLAERVAHRRELQLHPERFEHENVDADWVAQRCDIVDHIIELHGHIIGMALSPDHRYLYVNCRPWPPNYHIDHPLDPPPIAQEIDIHVIDMEILKPVGKLLRAHKAYTPNDECFFIFLDVSEDYVASGAEDKHGYLWDRHYGTCIAKYPHEDVVNAIAFNPKDPEMLVTASDDFTLKIWRSRSLCNHLEIDTSDCGKGAETRSKIK